MAQEIVGFVLEVASKIKETVERVKTNREQAVELGNRVEIVSTAVSKLRDDPRRDYVPALNDLLSVLEECSSFLTVLEDLDKKKKKKNGFIQFFVEVLHSNSYKEKFEELSLRIEESSANLNLALAAHTVFNADAMRQAEAKDAAKIKRILLQVLQNVEENHKAVAKGLGSIQDGGRRNKEEIIQALQDQCDKLLKKQEEQSGSSNEELKEQLAMQGIMMQQMLQEQRNLLKAMQEQQRQMAQGLLAPPVAPNARPVSPGPGSFNEEADKLSEAVLVRLREMAKIVNEVHEDDKKRQDAGQRPVSADPKASAHDAREQARERLRRRHRIDAKLVQIGESFQQDDLFIWCHAVYLGNKVLVKRFKYTDPNTESIFFHEVAALSGLQGPNILSFYGACFDKDNLFLVYEAVEGHLMPALEGPARPSLLTIIEWMTDIACAVHYLHSRKVIIGNIHPGSVVISSSDGRVKLTNFGFSQTLVSSMRQPPSIVDVGSVRRTFEDSHFLAPERFELATAQATQASDIFGLGMVFWAMMQAGGLPAGFHSAKFADFKDRLLSAIPKEFHTLFSNCTSLPPAERCSAGVIVGELARLRERRIQTEATYKRGFKIEWQLEPYIKAANNDVSLLSDSKKALLVQAKECYEEALEGGYMKAATNLGFFHSNGWACDSPNLSRGFDFYLEAASHPTEPHPRAMHNVAVCYHYGRGVAVDKAKALEWYQKGKLYGFRQDEEDFKKKLDAIIAKLSSEVDVAKGR